MRGPLSSSAPSGLQAPKENPYTHASIWINGRYAAVQEIVKDSEAARSPFEELTFRFIREWISGQETFSMTTSGSTGPPKRIVLSRKQMIVSARLTAAQIKLRNDATALLCIDPSYIGGKMMLVRSLVLGLQIVAVDPVANPLVSIPVDKCVEFAAFVPYQVQSILESKHPHLLNNLNQVLIGGAPLNAAICQALDRFQCKCYETYGMTETISHIALRLVNTDLKQAHFHVLPGVSISQDARGCLVVNAGHLHEPVVTNDIIEIAGPHEFLWLGRWDNVINTGGVKVLPDKVERPLERIFLDNNLHSRFFIAALPDEKLGNRLVLIIEGVDFSSEILKQSLDQLKLVVGPYEIPKEVYSVPAFKTTGTQKIDRIGTIAETTLLTRVDI